MTETAISAEDAEEYTQSLGQVVGGAWRQIAWASRMGIPEALGLSTNEWVEQRLGGYVRLSVSERREAVRELTAPPDDGGHGMTQREAADVLGVSPSTVNAALKPSPVQNRTSKPSEQGKEASDVQNRTPYAGAILDDDEGDSRPTAEPITVLLSSDIPGDDEDEDEDDEPDLFAEMLPIPEPADEPSPAPEAEKPKGAHVGKNSGDNEWYTPDTFIKAAKAVMRTIDLDPASSAAANEVVGAYDYYTEEQDGLAQPWEGRVWMNPPYAQPLVDRFCTRLAREYRGGSVTEACVLVNNATETNWFQEVLATASAVCFPRGRVKFWHPSKEAVPLQGQAVIYLGQHAAEFKAEFLRFGPVGLF